MKENSPCTHIDKWQTAGTTMTTLGGNVLLIITTLYCTGCGEIKNKAEKVIIK